MAIFKKKFKKKSKVKLPKGFHSLRVSAVTKLPSNSVKIEFDVPVELKKAFSFKPGQYLNFSIPTDGKELRRSYSICSGKNEPLAVAVKKIDNGVISTWFNHVVKENDFILTSPPEGNFILQPEEKNVVAIAAGSGITPIMSIAKELEENGGSLNLLYGNRTINDALFSYELEKLNNTTVSHFISGGDNETRYKGRIDKTSFSSFIKDDLSILKSDVFFLCGPEQMIVDIADTLEMFGVTTPVLMKQEEEDEDHFTGNSQVTVILDAEKIEFTLSSDKTLLGKVIEEGVDAPYSCKGGVCSSCKAKILKGKAHMKMNYSLTDKELEEGYILTCQAEPRSETLLISYDD